MRGMRLVVFIVFSTVAGCAQTSSPAPPQSARQALVEMFMGKGTDDFIKHLPNDARKALVRKGETPETSAVLRIASGVREITGSAARIETFETGPDLFISEEVGTHETVEIAVEHDSLLGDDDEIELSVHVSKNGEPQPLPVLPVLVFRLRQEDDVWRLIEAIVSARVPLTDPDYLQGVRKQQDDANSAGARVRLTIIAEAENRYAAEHREIGYSCSLTTLFAPSADPGQTGYYAAGFAGEEANAYRFALSGCEGTPASKFRLIAVPIDSGSEMKVLCTDESGKIKSIQQSKKSSCFSRGEVVSEAPVPSYSAD